MKKTLFILSFILLSVASFAQRQRTTAMFDSDTTTRPKAGFYGIGVRANNIYFVPPTGNNIRLANYSLFTGLTTSYVTKWNGSKFVNSGVFESDGNVGIGTPIPISSLDVRGLNEAIPSLYSDPSGTILIGSNSTSAAMSIGVNGGAYAYLQYRGRTGDGGAYPLVLNPLGGNVGIGTTTPTSKLQVVGLPTYADNVAATSGGLTSGAFYRTSTGVLMVVY